MPFSTIPPLLGSRMMGSCSLTARYPKTKSTWRISAPTTPTTKPLFMESVFLTPSRYSQPQPSPSESSSSSLLEPTQTRPLRSEQFTSLAPLLSLLASLESPDGLGEALALGDVLADALVDASPPHAGV